MRREPKGRFVRWRLSLLMFLQYAPAGAVIPLFTVRMQALGFTSREMGWACATQAMAALAGPLTAGQVADRWCPAERCLAVLAFLAGTALWLLAGLTEPLPFFLASLAFWFMMGPAITLGTSLSFTHLANAQLHFGSVRLWGTVGWVVSGWLLGYWFTDPDHDLSDIFRLGALLSWAFAAYSLTLPHTPPPRHPVTRFAPLAALHLARSRPFAVYLICTLGMSATLPFSAQVTPLLLRHLGLPLERMGPTLTLGQSMEIVSLAFLPVLLRNLGVRGTMLLGMTAWLANLSILSLGQPTGLVIAAMTLNGLCVCGYFVAGQVFINGRAHGEIRASAQALFAFVGGAGMLIGNLLVGEVRGLVDGAFAPTFAVGAALAGGLMAVFLVGFRPEEEAEPELQQTRSILAARASE